MNIVLVSEFFPHSELGELRGGAEARTFYLVKQLAEQHTVTVVASMEAGMESENRMFGGRVQVLRCGSVRSFTQAGSLIARLNFMFAVVKRLHSMKGDIVDGQSFVTYIPVWLGGRGFTRRVITVHDVWIGRWFRLFGPLGMLGELYERYILSRPWDLYLANSKITKQLLQQRLKAKNDVRVLYNGIDYQEISQTLSLPKYGWPTLCYVGRLVEYKRVQDLIEATSYLVHVRPNIQVKIVGVGPYENTLREQVRKLQLRQVVEFLGHIPSHQNVLQVLRRSHVFCLPSVVEGFGMVTVEAMAVGTPFVNADIPVTREVTNGKGGVFFTPKNPNDLAEKLHRMLSDAELAEKLSRTGIERAKEFDWVNIAKQLETLYDDVVHREEKQ